MASGMIVQNFNKIKPSLICKDLAIIFEILTLKRKSHQDIILEQFYHL